MSEASVKVKFLMISANYMLKNHPFPFAPSKNMSMEIKCRTDYNRFQNGSASFEHADTHRFAFKKTELAVPKRHPLVVYSTC